MKPRGSGREQLPAFELDEAVVRLTQWRAFLLKGAASAPPRIHVVGVNQKTGCCRVSSPVVRIRPAARRVATQSGRLYDLTGACGAADVCLAMLGRLVGPSRPEVVADVTGWFFHGTRGPWVTWRGAGQSLELAVH